MIKKLKLRGMRRVLHKFGKPPGAAMGRNLLCCWVLLAAGLASEHVWAQGYPGGVGGGGAVGAGARGPQSEIPNTPVEEKPDKAAAKAYAAGMKTMGKAHEQEAILLKETDAEKRGRAREKLEDFYGRAIDQFTQVLRNQDMSDAWNQICYVHLQLGAYREAMDDCNHALKIKPDLLQAEHSRGEAYLGIDRLDDAKASYMDLFYHSRPLADQLLVSMHVWLKNHRAAAGGMRATDIDAFDKWLQERDGIANPTASNPPP
jgi:tetratricopeptide (TPR) repeat protein